jgi:hypothetical protein
VGLETKTDLGEVYRTYGGRRNKCKMLVEETSKNEPRGRNVRRLKDDIHVQEVLERTNRQLSSDTTRAA